MYYFFCGGGFSVCVNIRFLRLEGSVFFCCGSVRLWGGQALSLSIMILGWCVQGWRLCGFAADGAALNGVSSKWQAGRQLMRVIEQCLDRIFFSGGCLFQVSHCWGESALCVSQPQPRVGLERAAAIGPWLDTSLAQDSRFTGLSCSGSCMPRKEFTMTQHCFHSGRRFDVGTKLEGEVEVPFCRPGQPER